MNAQTTPPSPIPANAEALPPAPPDAVALEREIRGRLYQELDLLAYAFEMEAAQEVVAGRDDDAARTQQTRLGIRLAQRLVGGAPAPEVDRRLERWRQQYRAKFPR